MPPPFEEAVKGLRARYQTFRDGTNIFSPNGRQICGMHIERIERVVFWYGEDPKSATCIRVVDRPGTLSGDILRLLKPMPAVHGNFEVDGNTVYPIPYPPPLPESDEAADDLSSAMARLPLVSPDPDKHHIKRVKYASEISNYLKCQGGDCPGKPKSPNIVQLLGRCSDTDIVFKKYVPRQAIIYRVHSQATYKRWILQLIQGLACLHSLGIVHRDLRVENLLFTKDGNTIIICDLESHWGIRRAPEIDRGIHLDAGWTKKSDIYDLGSCIQALIYGNAPLLPTVEWPVPEPFATIVEACQNVRPWQRPNLTKLADMVKSI
ncbi:hypothetical protein GJ744_005576 [Endocarpon pusillum]|uniref:EKC/KEOPS complex subunit BUD32 n=1 Tax=Endocarpon pusillum TaxID=364733 RepID=A0A8H7E7A7_9EURO|nr:hypothetical protein GJ744_005576 [Endocarpon pusillum]